MRSVQKRLARIERPSALKYVDDLFAVSSGQSTDSVPHVQGMLPLNDGDYRMLFECSPLPMWVYDAVTFRFLAANDTAARLHGYSRSALLSMTLHDLLLPSQEADSWSWLGSQPDPAADGMATDVLRCRNRDGTVSEMEVLTRAIGFQGKPSGLMIAKGPLVSKCEEKGSLAIRAYRRRKENAAQRRRLEMRFQAVVDKMEGRLQEANARMSAILENMADAFVSVDRQWRYTYINAAAEKNLGRSRAELLGQDLRELDPNAVEFRQQYENAMADRVPIRFEAWTERWGVWTEVSAFPSAGGLSLFYRDITERKRAEKAVQESEERYRQLVELCPDAIYIRRDFRIVFVNTAALELFGASTPDQLLGKSIFDLAPPEFTRLIKARTYRMLKSHRTEALAEWKALRLDGTIRDIEVVSAPIETLEGPAILAVIRDITSRKQFERKILEAIEREQERIGQDLHDGLCQSLVATKYRVGQLELLLAREAHHRDMDEVKGIEQMLNEAIGNVRRVARGLSPIKLSGNGLAHALEELASITELAMRVRCSCRLPKRFSLSDDVIGNHLYRIAQEAVQNAMKHGHPKMILIRLTHGANQLTLSVEHDGVGFSGEAAVNGGMGLNNMKVRAAMIGATLEIRQRKHGGTIVVCSLHSVPGKKEAGYVTRQ